MLVTVTQCVFSMAQSFVVALVAERDFSRWKLQLDISLLAIIYTVLVNYCIFLLTTTAANSSAQIIIDGAIC